MHGLNAGQAGDQKRPAVERPARRSSDPPRNSGAEDQAVRVAVRMEGPALQRSSMILARRIEGGKGRAEKSAHARLVKPGGDLPAGHVCGERGDIGLFRHADHIDLPGSSPGSG